MELKFRKTQSKEFNLCFLLIVPYGIEMNSSNLHEHLFALLIVPYGIEIKEPIYSSCSCISLNCTLWN